MKRTHYCGSIREKDIGEVITVNGWVQARRDMGGVIFLDVHDCEGTLQTVFDACHLSAAEFALAEHVKNQSVVAISGRVRLRDEETYNPVLETGTVELYADRLELISASEPLPFPLEEAAGVREELRLKYRFLDLRRPEMLANLRFRHKVVKAARDYLDAAGFLEVETPILTKSTPEGARDYLVPSRVHPGRFYALPQSPQIFKQLLMVGGADKYYQIARCFRDEDLRADRQPEFTQVDMELSFVDQEDILQHLERMFRYLLRECIGWEPAGAFPRITWREAMDRYGSDKPDLRFDLPIVDVTDIAADCSFSVFRKAVDNGGIVRAINVQGCADFSRSTIEELTQKALRYGAQGMAWIAWRADGEIYSILDKYFTSDEMKRLLETVDAHPGDFILFCADQFTTVCRVLGNLRLDLGNLLNLREEGKFAFLFVTDFPQFEYSEEEGRYLAMHHPFTMPYEEDLPYVQSDPARVRAQAYDLVLNGVELGSGSIRIHRRDVQEQMFAALGFSEQEIEERFGFLVNAFRYGTPPHGGFAFGLDRLVMLLCGAKSLREVIAFPKLKDASCPLTDAPGLVDEKQLQVLALSAGEQEQMGQTSRQGHPIDVPKIAALSQLALQEDEQKEAGREMAELIAFADALGAVDTRWVVPTSHMIALSNVYREDVPGDMWNREELLQNAPTQQDGYFSVPQILE